MTLLKLIAITCFALAASALQGATTSDSTRVGTVLSPVSGRVWIDADRDGIRDPTETQTPPGVLVELMGVTGQPISTSHPNPSGAYDFGPQPAGSYVLQFRVAPDFVFTTPRVGEPAFDSDVDTMGRSLAFTVAGTPTIIDAGCLDQKAPVSGRVWIDTDRDGTRDLTETLAPPGAPVELIDHASGQVVTARHPSPSGYFDFGLVLPGTYLLQFRVAPDFVFTAPRVGAPALDSDVDPFGRSLPFTVAGVPTNIDAGCMDQKAQVVGRVWIDTDRDGTRDPSETQVPQGAAVELIDHASGHVVAVRIPNQDGGYDFGLQVPGTYMLLVRVAPDFVFTTPRVGGPYPDSDVDPMGRTLPFTIAGTPTILDAGCVDQKAPVFGMVWIDADRDGIRDPAETQVPPGAMVELIDHTSGHPLTMRIPNEFGFYDFGMQMPGSYLLQVRVAPDFVFTIPRVGGPYPDSDVDPMGRTLPFTIAGTPTILDAGCVDQKAPVFGMVWIDADRDGIRDPAETQVPPGAMVELIDHTSGHPLTMRIPNEFGFYDFGMQMPGSYLLQVHVAPDFVFTTPRVGGPYPDSDVDPMGRTLPFTIAGTPTILDAGCVDQKAAVFGRVWIDADRDGIQNPSETRVPPHTMVELVDHASGHVVAMRIPNEYGFYDFGLQMPGSYLVQARVPPGFAFTTPGVGNPAFGSDVDLAGRSPILTIAGSPLVIDIGVVEPLPFAVAINFQPATTQVPLGYVPDTGAVFANRNGLAYGWNLANDHTRDRNATAAPDQRWDTLNHFQKRSGLRWELAVPAGWYEVTVACGDPGYTDQINTLDIEGAIAVDPDGYDRFDLHTMRVQVLDGRLTIAPAVAAGAINAKICFIEVIAVPVGNG